MIWIAITFIAGPMFALACAAASQHWRATRAEGGRRAVARCVQRGSAGPTILGRAALPRRPDQRLLFGQLLIR